VIDEESFQKLEIMLAHQERQIQDLGEIVTRQWREIESLKKSLAKTEAKLGDLALAGQAQDGAAALSTAEFAASEKPPHY